MEFFNESITATACVALQNEVGTGGGVNVCVSVGTAVKETGVSVGEAVLMNVEVAEGAGGTVAVSVGGGGVDAGSEHPVSRMSPIHAMNNRFIKISSFYLRLR